MTVLVEKDVDIPLRDGVCLRADVYRPNDSARHPVLLQRTPYNKELWQITALTLDPLKAAAMGYVVVIADVRARWASQGGVFFPYQNEADDGYDSIDWCAKQAFSNGRVGCYGLSYMGGTSWLAALSGHDALRAISPTTAPNDFWRNHFWRGGALNIGTLAMWALRAIGPAAMLRGCSDLSQLAAPFAQLFEDIDGFAEVVNQLPLNQLAAARPHDNKFVPFFFEFMRHPAPDDWTRSVLFSDRHAEVRAPSLTIAGWHDLLLAADLEHYTGMRNNAGSEQARQHSRLIVGPWAHGMFQHVVGDVDFGFRANGMFLDLKEDLTRLQLRWFERWLETDASAGDDDAPVRLFVQGLNRWRDETSWPPQGVTYEPWYLDGNGYFGPQAPVEVEPPVSYVYDPNDPCPTAGGNTLLPPQYAVGPVDQRHIAARRDVVAYYSAPLNEPLELTGPVRAEIYAATSALDTDFMVKLCEQHADGRLINICDGVIRASLRDGKQHTLLTPDEIYCYAIDLWATSIVIPRGHRLAVLITSSDFPRYDRNPNTGELAHEASEMQAALQRIFHQPARASRIVLPCMR